MDRRVLLGLSLLVVLLSFKLTVTKASNGEGEQRGLFLNTLTTGGKFLGLFQNYTAAKLVKNTSLLTALLNATGSSLFGIKKIAFLTALSNVTADQLIAKNNYTDFKLIKKLALLGNSTTLGIKSAFNTSAVFINNLLAAKLSLKNSTLTAKLQFANASTIALQSALAAKKNTTALLTLLNSTSLLTNKINKKNLTLLLADTLEDQLGDDLFFDKFNKTGIKNNDEEDYGNEAADQDEYQVNYQLEYV